MSTEVRQAVFSDYPIIVEYDDFIGDRRLDMQRNEILVADQDEAIAVGYAKVCTDQFFYWPLLANLIVKEDFRRRGIGTSIVSHLIEETEFVRLYTSTEEDNVAMRGLMTTLGIEQVGFVDGLNLDDTREILYRLK